MSTPTASPTPDPFDLWVAAVQSRVAALTAKKAPIFQTAATDLFVRYLDAFDTPERQREHRCGTCARFLARYGGLVVLDDHGAPTPLCWGAGKEVPPAYAAVARALSAAVTRAPLTGVFLSSKAAWGAAEKGAWTHLACPSPRVFHHALQTAAQAMAEKRQDHETLRRALEAFPVALVRQARALLDTEALYRSETCLGVATWLLELHKRQDKVRGTVARENDLWRAVATAPPGFCHVRSTMIGTLLEDLAAKLPLPEVKRRFAAKMHPLQYQRPQSAPGAGNIAQAEKIMATLQSAGALQRRFARLEDIEALWRPLSPAAPPRSARGGVFAHLKPKQATDSASALDAPPAVITWEKFARTVLPGAERIHCLLPTDRGPFAAFVTAANADAPPIVQWDRPDRRNPVTWYLYSGGSLAADWNLRAGAWHPVTAVALSPAAWDPKNSFAHQGNMAVFVLEGARDLRHSKGGGLFPSHLKNEYHAIRKTLEAYAQAANIAGRDEASACGLALHGSSTDWKPTLRVTTDGLAVSYQIDRWD